MRSTDILARLYDGLSRRPRPEDVAELILEQLDGRLNARERVALETAARGSLRRNAWGFSSMLADFRRADAITAKVDRAKQLFASASSFAITRDECGDPVKVEAFLRHVAPEIRASFGEIDWKRDRLDRRGRKAEGLDLSRRKYNRKFRLLRRLEERLASLVRVRRQVELTMIGKSSLASRVPRDRFLANASTACFVAYYASRASLRSEFTNGPQQRAFDDISAMLIARCERDPDTDWLVIAHVLPRPEVLARVHDEDKLALLATWHGVLDETAELLRVTWEKSRFRRDTMIVKRGDDSSTWNQLAGAWNKARDGWIALLHVLGMEDVLDAMCIGKVLRLMAADVAHWHRASGGALEPDTAVWSALPPPWEVLRGEAWCTRAHVEETCRAVGVDPTAKGWIAPRPKGEPVPFRPTPELVHGVSVGHPALARMLRRAGWFSGQVERLRPLGA
ncbi:hypothetical protein [Sandaracinus amylolyticus]|uniref:Uncharacterized protein n=1 Tax=Sandaracinus amylolyticus TaxID=927083 RepID=A0A0F6W719_9BACT|nr:hypothetical protein [Sandaracinus amylolyticus]AKF09067.1 hypothetical protein DB32_006216 [Sandaracinus amylolyticus]